MKDPVVKTKNGSVRGCVQHSKEENYDYCAFLGIPYAEPPIGDLRFKEPVPIKNWEGIKDTKKYGNPCAQYDEKKKTYGGSEDCLYLNVFVRSLENILAKKPVMILIHGGAFMFGSGDDYHFGPDYLLRKDIVLVTLNYRLGVFGFLNLEDEIAPGNLGLKDQILVLHWVRDNISNFGGDPSNVTLFGESGGATCIHYLSLSPLAKGLFHKAILQSGTVLSSFGQIFDPKSYIYKMVNFMGKYFRDIPSIYKLLKTSDAQRLLLAQEHVRRSGEKTYHMCIFGPCVDSKSPNPVMPIPLEEAVLAGIQIPVILGHNSHEGNGALLELTREVYDKIDKNFEKMIDPNARGVLLKRYGLTGQDLRHIYFKDKKITYNDRLKHADMLGDIVVVESVHTTARIQVDRGLKETYFYKFSYDREQTLIKALLPPGLRGACHFDEMEFLFYMKFREMLGFKPFKKGTLSYKIMDRMTELWTNFATYGSPTLEKTELLPVEWLPLNDGTNINYLNIDDPIDMKLMTNIDQQFLQYNAFKRQQNK